MEEASVVPSVAPFGIVADVGEKVRALSGNCKQYRTYIYKVMSKQRRPGV